MSQGAAMKDREILLAQAEALDNAVIDSVAKFGASDSLERMKEKVKTLRAQADRLTQTGAHTHLERNLARALSTIARTTNRVGDEYSALSELGQEVFRAIDADLLAILGPGNVAGVTIQHEPSGLAAIFEPREEAS